MNDVRYGENLGQDAVFVKAGLRGEHPGEVNGAEILEVSRSGSSF
jgi:hypothetical protein